MANGVVNIWGASKIAQGDADNSHLGQVQTMEGTVQALSFNPHHDSSHLLACGGR